MERKAFSFLRSFYEAACKLKDKAQQADFLLAVCNYALNGIEPDDISGEVAAMFVLVKPVLDISVVRAEAGAIGGRKNRKEEAKESEYETELSESEADELQNEANESTPEAIKDIGERRKDKGDIKPVRQIDVDFDAFWSEYPKKVGKGAARKAFEKARKKATLESLVTAVRRQKCGSQWTREDGRFIPNPATWLNQERWDDEVDGGNVDGISSGYPAGMDDPTMRRLWDEEMRNAL